MLRPGGKTGHTCARPQAGFSRHNGSTTIAPLTPNNHCVTALRLVPINRQLGQIVEQIRNIQQFGTGWHLWINICWHIQRVENNLTADRWALPGKQSLFGANKGHCDICMHCDLSYMASISIQPRGNICSNHRQAGIIDQLYCLAIGRAKLATETRAQQTVDNNALFNTEIAVKGDKGQIGLRSKLSGATGVLTQLLGQLNHLYRNIFGRCQSSYHIAISGVIARTTENTQQTG